MNTTIPNRTLYIHDNLDILRGMNSESIDLIATDPPFNKGRDFHATPDSLAAGARFQDRWSWEADVYPEWVDAIKDDQPALYELIDLVRTQKRDDLAAFLCWLGVRVIEMRRVLKPTGSLYLHCDPTASHYIKALLDSVFGGGTSRTKSSGIAPLRTYPAENGGGHTKTSCSIPKAKTGLSTAYTRPSRTRNSRNIDTKTSAGAIC